jgi:hypothetical protein
LRRTLFRPLPFLKAPDSSSVVSDFSRKRKILLEEVLDGCRAGQVTPAQVTSQSQGAEVKVSGKPRQLTGFADPGEEAGGGEHQVEPLGRVRKMRFEPPHLLEPNPIPNLLPLMHSDTNSTESVSLDSVNNVEST